MKRVVVYGPGCPKCKQLEEQVRRVVAESGADALVEKVTDIQAMMAAGVMSTPAVSVDGVIRSAGRIPKDDDIREWLK